ncbi:cytochrome P450 family protein [Dictyobacter aurantiacus]|uniref:Polyketide biosynthesis cytochrome P450 PksS n=1 Tax=Dictyobacter aurantiacus TaxID=1936993 RepID=A0A401ZRC2_9CHLR|nr:cytochrome P450 [Dictyobacter aurantiacus]GCE09458.1 polyketide biosynthesis cytochrome P450 PksS [Dictyobacter aurantiacus]
MMKKSPDSATVSTSSIAPVNVVDARFKANPFPFYAQLRAEAPVFTVTLPTKQRAWLITRYDDVLSVLKDERFAKDRRNAMTPEQLKKMPWIPPMFKPLERNMLDLDSPDHTRLRALVHKAFTPRLIEQMRDQIQALTDELLDAAERKGSVDLIADFALPLPLTVIGRMLGVPARDNPRFHRWTKAVLSAGTNMNYVVLIPSIMRFMGYLKKLTKERRAHPQDDLITALVQARDGSDQLSEDEVLAMIFLLLIAGHETTVNLIGSGTLALLEHPDQLEKLRGDPTLIKPAIEELLRFVCPVEMATERYAREDIEIAGTTIPRGELVLAVIGSANRDASHFENPDALDITRKNNRHLAFGQGAHYCLGAPLSRLEGQIAITTLVQRMPGLRLNTAPEQIRWRGGFILRGLEALPVSF